MTTKYNISYLFCLIFSFSVLSCSEDKTMLLSYNFFSLNMGKGEIIAAIPIREKKWFFPPKNTIGKKQIQFICNFNKQV